MKELCKEENCQISTCSKRHQKECKVPRKYHPCKFGEYCNYLHVENLSHAYDNHLVKDFIEKVEALESDHKYLKIKVDKFEDKYVKMEKNYGKKVV